MNDKAIIKILSGVVMILSVPLAFLFLAGTILATVQGQYFLATKSAGLSLVVLFALVISILEFTEC